MKRIVLFLATTLAVVLVLSVVARLLGLDAWLAVHGSSLGGLLVFAAFFGFSGSFISLAMSKWMAKMTMGVRDRKSTRLNSSHSQISHAVFCLKKKSTQPARRQNENARRALFPVFGRSECPNTHRSVPWAFWIVSTAFASMISSPSTKQQSQKE